MQIILGILGIQLGLERPILEPRNDPDSNSDPRVQKSIQYVFYLDPDMNETCTFRSILV